MNKQKVTLFWFRRDLRLEDNHGLLMALRQECPVQPIFIFDSEILDELKNKKDGRVEFIHQALIGIQEKLTKQGASLDVRIGKPIEIWKQLVLDYAIDSVWANKDYEPYARDRDKEVHDLLRSHGVEFKAKKDHVIFEKNEILKSNGTPYVVYTPYSKLWKAELRPDHYQHYPSEAESNWNTQTLPFPSLAEIGFVPSEITFPQQELNLDIVKNYHETRDIPSKKGTTRMSVHLRFGTVSIRALVRESLSLNEKYLNELIWRDFYQMILWQFPDVVNQNFNRKYDGVQWRNDPDEFEKWKQGMTGYPIVDAGMRELNETGHMHNRVRMIVASFLTKHLLIDWRWGEAYFAEKLLDFELASNNGGWQWAAGTGVDAQPYFRIFNPYSQTEKFDKQKAYIKQWIPEFGTPQYPQPIVDHSFARERCLEVYKAGMSA